VSSIRDGVPIYALSVSLRPNLSPEGSSFLALYFVLCSFFFQEIKAIKCGSNDNFVADDNINQIPVFKRRDLLISQLLSEGGHQVSLTFTGNMKPSSAYFPAEEEEEGEEEFDPTKKAEKAARESKKVDLVSSTGGLFVFSLDLEPESRKSTMTYFA